MLLLLTYIRGGTAQNFNQQTGTGDFFCRPVSEYRYLLYVRATARYGRQAGDY